MRVAVVSDVHGNLAALDAVLADVAREDVDVVVCCGDVAGPFGAECVDRLGSLGDRVRLIRGNGDEDVDWPLTIELEVDGLGRVLFCHGSPRDENEILTKLTSEERAAEALADVDADVVVGGHTHVQYDRTVAGRRLVNAGSVGMPYEGVGGAFWALVGPTVELRRTEYDVEAAAAEIENAGAADQASFLRDPRDPDDVSAYFESLVGA